MRSTPWAAYTPGMVLNLLGFVVFLFLVLFGLTLLCVGGFFCLTIVRESVPRQAVRRVREESGVRDPGGRYGPGGDRLRAAARSLHLLAHPSVIALPRTARRKSVRNPQNAGSWSESVRSPEQSRPGHSGSLPRSSATSARQPSACAASATPSSTGRSDRRSPENH